MQAPTPNTSMICTVCKRHKSDLKTRKSKLAPNISLFLCNSCFTAKLEPRFLVILVARDRHHGGLDKARDYIRSHRYFGEKITADELV